MWKIRSIPTELNNLGQESTNTFCKGTESNYFMLVGHTISVTATQLCHNCTKAAICQISKQACSNNTLLTTYGQPTHQQYFADTFSNLRDFKIVIKSATWLLFTAYDKMQEKREKRENQPLNIQELETAAFGKKKFFFLILPLQMANMLKLRNSFWEKFKYPGLLGKHGLNKGQQITKGLLQILRVCLEELLC